ISRAVRTPSRAEDDVTLNRAQEVAPGFFVPTTIQGNHNVESEQLLAYEIGYRAQPHPAVSLDLAAFYNDYDTLRSLEQNPAAPTQFVLGNELYGETYGAETAVTWKVLPWWKLVPSYTFLQMQLHRRAGSTDISSEQDEGKSPHHQFSLRSGMDFPHDISLD